MHAPRAEHTYGRFQGEVVMYDRGGGGATPRAPRPSGLAAACAPSTALVVAPAYPGAASGRALPPSRDGALLAMCGLSDYWPNFEEEGYDDLTYLLEVDEGGLEEVADDCKIEKKGHRARLFKRLEQLREPAAPPAGPLFD